MTAKTRIASGVAAVIATLACSVATAAVQINILNVDGPGERLQRPHSRRPGGWQPWYDPR